MSIRERKTFTEEFKLQMVQLYNNGKAPSEIVKEYDLSKSTLMNWI
jgi:transposase